MPYLGSHHSTVLDKISHHVITLICLMSVVGTKAEISDINIKDNHPINSNVFDLNTLINVDPSMSKTKYTLSKAYKAGRYFEIKNHKIFTKSTIDIDSMCSEIKECCDKEIDYCNLKISVIYSTGLKSQTDIKKLDIRVEDINDHSPQFEKTSLEIELSESKRNQDFVILPKASDADFGKNRIQMYKIESKEPLLFDDYFMLDVRRDVSVPSQVSLKLKKALDRETIASFSFELLAIDGDLTSKKTGSMTIIINIIDENDNRPIFEKQFYKETIKEGFFSSLPILTLSATDADEGDNAKVVYNLSPGSIGDSSITNQFRIQPDGKIYLKNTLDYEKRHLYKFSVIATNPTMFTNRLVPSTATVEIEVENVDDELLQIVIDYPDGKNWSQIAENSKGEFIAFVTVRSIESGRQNLKIVCRLQTFEQIFELLPKPNNDPATKSFEIRTVIGIDREEHSRVQTNILCSDSDSGGSKLSEAPLLVIVTDQNDNYPQLTIDGKTTVKENEKIGKVLFTVRANDTDEKENGRVTFSLDKSDPVSLEYLSIGEMDGRVSVKNQIDCEANLEPLTSLDIVVTASDHGLEPKITDLKLIVNVQDDNDNIPIFVTFPLQFRVFENTPKSTLVGEIEVRDKDHGDRVTLRIININQLSFPFIITTKDNSIFLLNLTKSIDREKDSIFKFQVVASDGTDQRAHSVTETVEVKILDVNDNAPTILFPTQNNASVHRISYLEPINYKFILVSANDQDQLPENSRLEYFVDDELKIFGITNEEKYITTQREMKKSDIGDHKLRILVRDCGTPRLESNVIINIVIDQSSPKTVSLPTNHRFNSANGDRSSDIFLSVNSDSVLYITVTIIMVVIIIFIVIFVYCLCRCKKENGRFYNALMMCCQPPSSSSPVTKSMISSPTSKPNFNNDRSNYNTYHPMALLNNENFMDDRNRSDSWNHENSRVPSYNIATNPYPVANAPYTKLAHSPSIYYPYRHIYQTIENGQRPVDMGMQRIPSYQLKGKKGEQYKSELNLKRWNLGTDSNEYFATDNNGQGATWVTSQTPLPVRSRNITNTIHTTDLFDDNFAVAFPKDQSTFV